MRRASPRTAHAYDWHTNRGGIGLRVLLIGFVASLLAVSVKSQEPVYNQLFQRVHCPLKLPRRCGPPGAEILL